MEGYLYYGGCGNDGVCCSPGIQNISAVIAIVFRLIASIMTIKGIVDWLQLKEYLDDKEDEQGNESNEAIFNI